jgi:hypothetical protein
MSQPGGVARWVFTQGSVADHSLESQRGQYGWLRGRSRYAGAAFGAGC